MDDLINGINELFVSRLIRVGYLFEVVDILVNACSMIEQYVILGCI